MVALIFCDITVDLLALAGAIATGIAVTWTFGGATITELGNILFVIGGAGALTAGAVAFIPAALLFLTAFGITFPVVFHI